MNDRVAILEAIARESQRGIYKRKSDDQMHNRGLYDNPLSEYAKLGYRSVMRFDFERYVRTVDRRPLIIADIGCGMGRFLHDLKEIDNSIEVFGIDHFLYDGYISPSHFIVGEMSNEDHTANFLDNLPEYVFDIVTSANCLEPLSVEIGKTQIKQVNRVVSREGFAMIQIPDCFWNKKIFYAVSKEGVRMSHRRVEHLEYMESPSRIITITGPNFSESRLME